MTNHDRLIPNEKLDVPSSLRSANGLHELAMQTDGNLVVYHPEHHAVWASNTAGSGAIRVVMGYDGNLVIDGSTGPIWATATEGHPGSKIILQDDGNLVIYGHQNDVVWATN